MKKTAFLIGAFLLTLIFTTTLKAQSPIVGVDDVEQFFANGVDDGTPVLLNRLGSSPQFGRIRNHTAASAYARLKSAYRSRRHRAELDRLFIALGYTGFEDPSFSESAISPEILHANDTGWMGSRGNKYIKATFGKDFNGFKVSAKEGPAYVYIMQICGNVFHPPFPPCDTAQPCPECNNFQSWMASNSVNPFCACIPCPECQDTIDQTISVTGNSSISSGDRVMGEKEVELVASFGGVNLCLGTLSVPVNVSYEYEATGSTGASEVVTIDNQTGNALSSIDLKIPVSLDFDIEGSQTSFGDNGAIVMAVTAKRFAALKKIYAVCPTDISGTNMEGLSGLSMDAAADAVNGSGDGATGLKKQNLYFAGSNGISEVASKEHSTTITVIAHSKKTGKLINGESADRYLCLGQYAVAGSSALLYKLTGASSLTKSLEICDKEGDEPTDKNINLPIELQASITKQEMTAGNDGKVYIEITEQQYKKLGKRFSKCCTNGDSSCF